MAKPRACAAHSRGAVLYCTDDSDGRRSGAAFCAWRGARERRLGSGRRHPPHREPEAVLSTLRTGNATYLLAPVAAPGTSGRVCIARSSKGSSRGVRKLPRSIPLSDRVRQQASWMRHLIYSCSQAPS